MQASPRFVIVGAGSIFFTRAVAVGMCRDAHYDGATLVLLDTNPAVLDTMTKVGRRIVERTGANLTIEATTDRARALAKADFVVLSFSVKGVDLREVETQIPARYGVLQSSGDTIGPGGLFRAIRTIPAVLQVARDIEALCPEAWVFNYINPAPVVTAAIWQTTKLRKVLSLCDGILMPEKKYELMQRVGLPREVADEVTFKIGGINHFSFVTEFSQTGQDLMPRLLQHLRDHPEQYASQAVEKILEVFGYYCAIGGHMTEFLPYFQGHGSNPQESYTNYLFQISERRKWMKEFHQEIEEQAAGTRSVDDLIDNTHPDLTIRIANSVLDDSGEAHHVTFPNHGHITNLPESTMVELMARVYRDRFEGEVFGDMPRVLRGWMMRVADVQELTLEAALSGDSRLLRQALAADPLTVSLEDTDHIIADLIAAEGDDIPPSFRNR
jgi:alpha-galactosidase